MDGHFLFHGMLVQLTCSILELSLCPPCWRGKVFRVQWKVKMMSFGFFGSENFVFALCLDFSKKDIEWAPGSSGVSSVLLPCPTLLRMADNFTIIRICPSFSRLTVSALPDNSQNQQVISKN